MLGFWKLWILEIMKIEFCWMLCFVSSLTHWGRVTHICVSKKTIIGSDNGLSPGRRQAIIWTNAGILLIGNLGTNFSEILIEIRIFSFKKMGLNVSSAKWRPFCLGLNVLTFLARPQQGTINVFTRRYFILTQSLSLGLLFFYVIWIYSFTLKPCRVWFAGKSAR